MLGKWIIESSGRVVMPGKSIDKLDKGLLPI